MPAPAVINPPKRNRTKSSYQRVQQARGLKLYSHISLPQAEVPESERDSSPHRECRNGHPESFGATVHHHPAHA
jgi:hypothetical protein